MKISGMYHRDEDGQEISPLTVKVTIEIPQFDDSLPPADYMPDPIDTLKEVFQPNANQQAMTLALIAEMPIQLVIIALYLQAEAISEALNTVLAMQERVRAGEDLDKIYIDFFNRQQPGIFGDMVETEEASAFDGFIEGELGFDRLDEDRDDE